MVIIWVCGLSDNLNCIIEISNAAKGLSYSYAGPIGLLRFDNDPYTVFSKSDCLVLHSSALDKMAFDEDGKSVCEVKVMLTKKN